MESLFFNITDTKYKTTDIFKNKSEYIKRVDISNGLFFLDISLERSDIDFSFKNLDRAAVICVQKSGDVNLHDNIEDTDVRLKNNSINILLSSKQDIRVTTQNNATQMFVLCIADFFLKRYLSMKSAEPIDYLYGMLQKNITCKLVNTQSIDALSLYIIDKILSIKADSVMKSITCEQYVLEFIIQRLSLFDMIEDEIAEDEFCISKSAKDILLKSFTNPPGIELLAHMCATNETKLKKVFKKVYKTTIYGYIQKLRLEKANLLLKERSLNIGEIAKEVGYKHQGHFSKLFFETYGVYPKDLLKKGI